MGSQRQSTREVLSTKSKTKTLSLVQDKAKEKKVSLIVKRGRLAAPCLKPEKGAVQLRDLMSEEEVISVIASWLMAAAEQRASDRSPGASSSRDRKALREGA
jgi:hypothetical protein